MRVRWIGLALGMLLAGALGGALLAPQPASGVSKEMIQLQQQVTQLLQGQQDLRSAVDQKNAELRVLAEQSLDAVNRLNTNMNDVQKAVREVQATSGARIDTVATQTQSISDNLQVIQERVGKLSQQMTDTQNLLQSIDGKISGGAAPAGAPGGAGQNQPGGTTEAPPASSQVLYTTALRDFTSGKYDLAKQEFGDYLKFFQNTDLAGNAQFYLGEIYYAQGNFQDAITQYDAVGHNYPQSFKLAASRLKKAEALLEMGQKSTATREFREVVRLYPGTDESRRAQARLKQLSAAGRTR
jgi:tol-pal system protein YbgF